VDTAAETSDGDDGGMGTSVWAGRGCNPGADSVDQIEYWSRRNGIDAALAKAVAWHESGWQQDVISGAHAVGVMQLIPSAADHISHHLIGVDLDAYVLEDNVRMGVRYLRQLLEHFDGDERLAVAAYYQGEQAVREIGVYAESELYVANVMANRDYFAR
jgi:soluble lytic murein transglycosylase-like protein